MNNDLISVIVPVYNVKQVLNRCVDSIINQTYKNIEIILVDDGSSDGSDKICDEYKRNNKNIIVIHKENGGLSDARNAGIEKASGKYLLFIDSDDFINLKMIEILYNNLINNNADISICRPILFEDEKEIKNNEVEEKTIVYNEIEILRNMYDDYLITVVAWNKLYKRELFDEIMYPKGRIIEDSAVIHYLLSKAHRVVYSNLELYYYYQRHDSIMHKINYNLLDELDWLNDRINYFEKLNYINEKFFKETLNKYFEAFNHWIYILIKKNGYNAKIMNKYFDQFADIYIKYANKIDCSKIKADFIIKYKCLFFYLKGIKGVYNKIINKIHEKIIYRRLINRYEKYLKNNKDNIKYIIFNAPNHGNIGDHAILFAEKELLKDKDKICFVVVHDEIEYFIQKYSSTIEQRDVIFITGGGNLGDLWENEQTAVNKVIERFKENKIIIFPQTVFYSSGIHSIYRFEEDKRLYKTCKDLLFVCRDKKSFDLINEEFKIPCLQTSDIVTYLNYSNLNSNNKRKDILLCFRNDKERVTNNEQMNKITNCLRRKFKDENIRYVDTVFKGYFTLNKGEKFLRKFLKRTSRCKLFITDRLHGMIFATITGTPCIAMANSSGKVKGVYEWISKENKYVNFVDDIEKFEEILNNIDFNKKNIYVNNFARKNFDQILKGENYG